MQIWNIIEIIQMKFFAGALLGLLTTSQALNCENGSVSDSRNICIKPRYIEGCFTYASETKCASCNYNYDLQSTGLCAFNSSPNESCCVEMGVEGCKTCNRGLNLIGGVCTEVPILGCLQKSKEGKCTNCASDFVLENGTCKQGIKNCQQYADTSMKICAKCNPNYSLAQNNCLKNRVLGCKREENYNCVECYSPFKILQGRCVVDNCKDYNDFGCESCECGFYITRNSVCQEIEEGCIRYQKGICTDCYPPFVLEGTACIIDGCLEVEGVHCKKCKEIYELKDGVCKLPHCLSGKNGKCEICEEKFNYINGQCQETQQKLVFN